MFKYSLKSNSLKVPCLRHRILLWSFSWRRSRTRGWTIRRANDKVRNVKLEISGRRLRIHRPHRVEVQPETIDNSLVEMELAVKSVMTKRPWVRILLWIPFCVHHSCRSKNRKNKDVTRPYGKYCLAN